MNLSKSMNFCRYCLIDREKLSSNLYAVQKLRKTADYTLCVIEKEITRSMCFGVRTDSLLNSFKNDHVCNLGLSLCLARDLFEGFVSYDL